MRITWMGTACFVFETEQARVLFDPFVELVGGTNPNTIDDFLGEDVIFITHAHFDHLFFVPQILEESQATVFCGSVPARMLERSLESTERVAQFTVGQRIPIGDMNIRSYRGKHIVFDKRYLGETLSPGRILRYIRNMPFLLQANRHFQEKGETIAYGIEAEGWRILLLGSMNLDEKEQYPEDIDVLVLPYQGNNDLVREADRILSRLRPRCVILSHFDNAFPPMSRDVDLTGLKRLIREKYPQIRVLKPTRGRSIKLREKTCRSHPNRV